MSFKKKKVHSGMRFSPVHLSVRTRRSAWRGEEEEEDGGVGGTKTSDPSPLQQDSSISPPSPHNIPIRAA